jgi:ribosomal protein S18 acetylase RimI-like enzyme
MDDKIDFREFERTASNTGVFKGVEVDILHETLVSWSSSPGDPYTVLELKDGKTLVAFAIVSKTSGRESTYDIRYIVLDRDYRSTEGGKRILEMIDEDLLAKSSYAVIRLETSGKKLGNLGVACYEDSGYKIIGHIAGYYGEEDDYYYLMKTVYRNPPTFFTPSIPGKDDEAARAKAPGISECQDPTPNPEAPSAVAQTKSEAEE